MKFLLGILLGYLLSDSIDEFLGKTTTDEKPEYKAYTPPTPDESSPPYSSSPIGQTPPPSSPPPTQP